MLMDEGMDSGPILSRAPLPIDDSDTAASLSEKLAQFGADLLVETLPRWLNEEIQPIRQDPAEATTCPLLRKEDGAIDWSLPADQIWRRVRAYNPWPGASTSLDGELLHIWRARSLNAQLDGEPGIVVDVGRPLRSTLPDEDAQATSFAVQTGAGLLIPLEVQRAGRRTLTAAEFARGTPNLIGRRLS
jgi:methionyl-tRNA formyltransferase